MTSMYRKQLILILSLGFLLTSCASASSHYGKFNGLYGVPSFIKVGQTTRNEVFVNIGEPLVHRYTIGVETAIYRSTTGNYFFLSGTYFASELIVRFKDGIVSDVRIERVGSGSSSFDAHSTP